MILSGTGSDGALGLRAIKAEGGITIAQDQTAQVRGHAERPPRRPAASTASSRRRPSPKELARIGRHPQSQPPRPGPRRRSWSTPRSMQKIFIMLRRDTGVDFSQYKQSTVERRFRPADGPAQDRAAARITSSTCSTTPAKSTALFEDMLINVTGFLPRSRRPSKSLKKKVFPKILRARAAGRPIRVWVPGCSTGEEAYSIAIALLEYLAAERNCTRRSRSSPPTSAMPRSRRPGRASTRRASPPTFRRSGCGGTSSRSDDGYQISKSIRDMCIFARQNVVKDPPFSQIDLLSCRNLLIYLGAGAAKEADPDVPLRAEAGRLPFAGQLGDDRQLSGAVLAGRPQAQDLCQEGDGHARRPCTSAPSSSRRLPEAARRQAGPATAGALSEHLREADRFVLSRHAPAGVVVDDDMEIIQFRGQTDRYLAPSPGEAS